MVIVRERTEREQIMIGWLIVICLIVLAIKLVGFCFKICGKLLGGIFSIIGYLLMAIFAVGILRVAFVVVPVILAAGIVTIIGCASKA